MVVSLKQVELYLLEDNAPQMYRDLFFSFDLAISTTNAKQCRTLARRPNLVYFISLMSLCWSNAAACARPDNGSAG